MQERFFSPGMQPGIGVNLLDGTALEQSVSGSLTLPDAAGQHVESRIVRMEDIASLHTSLGVDVSASGSYMGFSASDKMNFADSCGFNEHSIYLLVCVVVTNALTRMNSPALTPEAALLLQSGKPDRFRQRFGDVFVAGVHTGGEYFAIFQITGTEDSEKESLSNTVTASYTTLGAGVDLSNTVTKAKESSHTHLDMKTFVFQNGGADTTSDQDPTQIINKAHNFAPSLTGANSHFAVPYAILPESYLTLDLPGDNANLIDIENQKEMLSTNFKIRNELMLLINNMDYILLSQAQNHNEFEPFDSDALTADRNRLAAEFDRITFEASACMRDATHCHLASFQPPSKPLPKKLPAEAASLADRGHTLALQDPLATAIRDSLPNLVQHGFDEGMAIAEGQTLLGPGKTKFIDELPTPDEKRGCELAVDYTVDRNRNSTLAQAGLKVAQAIPTVKNARDAEPAGLFTLGFDIGAGVFGDPVGTGALGHTADGPNAQKILADLTVGAQRGYVIARNLNLGPPALRR